MDRFADMESFLQIMEAGSISRAAQRMGIAKSALSRRLAELEDRLGAQLVVRSTRGLHPTEAGRIFHAHCQRIIADVADAERQISAQQTQLRGTLRITAPVSFAVRHLSAPLAAFLKDNPDIELQLVLTDRQIEIVEEGIDLAIRIGRLKDSQLMSRRLAPMLRVACASPAYLESFGMPETPADLAGHWGLESSHLPPSIHWQFTSETGQTTLARPKIRMRADNGDMLLRMALGGAGICTVPRFISADALRSGALVPVLPGYHLRQDGIFAVFPPARHEAHRVRVLLDYLVRSLKEEIDAG